MLQFSLFREEKKAEKETQLEFDGVRIDGFDESKPRVTVKVRFATFCCMKRLQRMCHVARFD